MISARDNSNAKPEPLAHSLSRVDWWAVVSALMIGSSAILVGHILAAVGHFVWRHWL